jgi:hypothetical protein
MTDIPRCPEHGIPDCSPLLNGCSRVNRIVAEYADLDRRGLIERLVAAEDVCRMYAWSAAPARTEREKAAMQLWMRWLDQAGREAVDVGRYPHLDDAAVLALATERDLIRHTTLRHLFGGDVADEAT